MIDDYCRALVLVFIIFILIIKIDKKGMAEFGDYLKECLIINASVSHLLTMTNS